MAIVGILSSTVRIRIEYGTPRVYYHGQKKRPPCNHLDISAFRLPTLARNQAGDRLIPSLGRQSQRTDVQVVARGDVFFSVYESVSYSVRWSVSRSLRITIAGRGYRADSVG